MPMPKAGDIAPDFMLLNQHGITTGLANYRGHHLLLWWYPKADTPG